MSDNGNVGMGADEKREGAPKRRRGNRLVVTGVVVAVVLVAAIGMFQWHEQPSFCGAFCHYSMDAYLETYVQEANAPGIDKYGNEVANTSAMMVVVHKGEDVACLDCHVPSVPQQAEELAETVTGNYTVVSRLGGAGTALHEVDADGLMEHAGHGNDGDAFCLRSGCHDLTRDELTERTSDMEFNPHRWNHSAFECSDCHKSHRASVFYCTRCHTDAESSLPDGWVAYDQSMQVLESRFA